MRKVRESCDDAMMDGKDMQGLTRTRSALEQKLAEQSRALRNVRGTPTQSSSGESHSRNFIDMSTNVRSPSTPVQAVLPNMQSIHSMHENAFPQDIPMEAMPIVPPAPGQSVFNEADGTDVSFQPRCSCGKLTELSKVLSGQNADRPYNKCLQCGFSSWAEGNLGEFTVNTTNNSSSSRDRRTVEEKLDLAMTMLQDVFGHSVFRPPQERIIQEAISGRDVFVLMPTYVLLS